jgi:polyphosphate kinase
MSSPKYFTHRDVSWLAFNYRVLQEAMDERVPLLERLKFMAIYSSNLDEFFRVRVASIRTLIRSGKKSKRALDFDPAEIFEELVATVNRQQEAFSRVFSEKIVPELAANQIHLVQPEKLTEAQGLFVRHYYQTKVARFVQPILLVKQKIRPFLINGALYLAATLEEKPGKTRYALLRIPSADTPRFVQLPSDDPARCYLILLDDVVRFCLPQLFPGFGIRESHSFKLTRDAELHIDDEFEGDLIEKIREGLAKRNAGPTTRFVYDRQMNRKKLRFLCDLFSIPREALIPEGRYHNNSDLMKFPDCGRTGLKEQALPPLHHPVLRHLPAVLRAPESEGDILLHFPYQSYEYVLRFFEEAADDPLVRSIKLTQYRVAKRSRILEALLRAVQKGKQVTIFVEVKARFDEDTNLQWAARLEKAGARVIYSLPGIKVHAKIALVTREEGGAQSHVAYLGTGNFNENTARIYTDLGLLTADPDLCREVGQVFHYLETGIEPVQPFQQLLIGRFNLFEEICRHIDREIESARAGRFAAITMKVNSIEEKSIVEKLYEASMAGVKIRLLVRGICCLMPGIEGVSDHIEAYSIVDRFLEHSRIYVFHNQGQEKIYLSSADLMGRNLFHRIECAFPVTAPALRREVLDYLAIMFSDTFKARHLRAGHVNQYRRPEDDADARRGQVETYRYYRDKLK